MVEEHTTAGGQPIEESLIEAREAQRYGVRDGRWTRLYDHIKREWQIYAMLLPTIIWFIVFLYKPMYGLQIAFKDYSIFRGVAGSPWIGLGTFSNAVHQRSVSARRIEHDQDQRAKPDIWLPCPDHPGADVQRDSSRQL